MFISPRRKIRWTSLLICLILVAIFVHSIHSFGYWASGFFIRQAGRTIVHYELGEPYHSLFPPHEQLQYSDTDQQWTAIYETRFVTSYFKNGQLKIKPAPIERY